MRLTWADLSQHRSTVNELQWRRMSCYFREGRSLSQVAIREGMRQSGGARLGATTNIERSIGRGSRRLLRAMLLLNTVAWTDIVQQARESAANPKQWRRLRAGLLLDTAATQIAQQ